MHELEAAIDDYLHTIVRSQPWIKKQEEDALLAFNDWLYEQPDMSRSLAAISPATTARYAQAVGLSAAEHEALDAALHHVFAWAEHQQVVAANPFPSSAIA
ncbi:MAG TPA: hypothetical protein VFZ66_29360 [Herpetosiphonaceae bacterium]